MKKCNDFDRYIGGFDLGCNDYDYDCNYGYDYGCNCGCGEKIIKKTLMKNIGRVVNIYAEVIGDFTGLVSKVEGNSVKLITSLPSAPYEMSRFERMDNNCDFKLDKHCRNSHFGSAVIIPLCKITAVSVVEI